MRYLVIVLILISCSFQGSEEIRTEPAPANTEQVLADSSYWPLGGSALQTDNVLIDGAGHGFKWTSDGSPEFSIGVTDAGKFSSLLLSHEQTTFDFNNGETATVIDFGTNVGAGGGTLGMAIQTDEFEILTAGNRFVIDTDDGITIETHDNIRFLLSPGKFFRINSDFILNAQGNGIKIKQGLNATAGTSTALSGGMVTINTDKVKTTSMIFVQRQTDGGTVSASYSITKIQGVSFTITGKDASGATNTADASTLAWWILNPAP